MIANLSDYKTNSLCPDKRNCLKKSVENIDSDVGVKRSPCHSLWVTAYKFNCS